MGDENKKFKYLKFEKLIRDGNIKTIKDIGGEVVYNILQKKDLIYELKKKLVEEANEVLEAKTIEETIDEIGDVFDILQVLTKQLKINRIKVWKSRRKKSKQRGKIKKGVYCKYVKVPFDRNDKWMYKYEDITEEINNNTYSSNKKF